MQRLRLVMALSVFCHITLILSFNHTQHQVLSGVFLAVFVHDYFFGRQPCGGQ